jgi:hypothetical protein
MIAETTNMSGMCPLVHERRALTTQAPTRMPADTPWHELRSILGREDIMFAAL